MQHLCVDVGLREQPLVHGSIDAAGDGYLSALLKEIKKVSGAWVLWDGVLLLGSPAFESRVGGGRLNHLKLGGSESE